MHAHEYDYWLASKVYTDPTPLRPQTHLDAGCTSCIIFVLARVAQGATLGLSRFAGIVLARLAIIRFAQLLSRLRRVHARRAPDADLSISFGLILSYEAESARRQPRRRRKLPADAGLAILGNSRTTREVLSRGACVGRTRRFACVRLVRSRCAAGARCRLAWKRLGRADLACFALCLSGR